MFSNVPPPRCLSLSVSVSVSLCLSLILSPLPPSPPPAPHLSSLFDLVDEMESIDRVTNSDFTDDGMGGTWDDDLAVMGAAPLNSLDDLHFGEDRATDSLWLHEHATAEGNLPSRSRVRRGGKQRSSRSTAASKGLKRSKGSSSSRRSRGFPAFDLQTTGGRGGKEGKGEGKRRAARVVAEVGDVVVEAPRRRKGEVADGRRRRRRGGSDLHGVSLRPPRRSRDDAWQEEGDEGEEEEGNAADGGSIDEDNDHAQHSGGEGLAASTGTGSYDEDEGDASEGGAPDDRAGEGGEEGEEEDDEDWREEEEGEESEEDAIHAYAREWG